MRVFKWLCLLALVLPLWGTDASARKRSSRSSRSSRPMVVAPARPAAPDPQSALVERTLLTMSRQEKVAQLLLIGFGGTEIGDFLRTWVGHKRVGGVALFARNLRGPAQIRALTSGIAALSQGGVAPFVAIDQEGGPVLRIRNDFAVLPGNMVLGATGDRALAYAAGRATASDLLRLGFNMNFAPVLDVNSNPDNPVINVRSFGERPADVAALGRAFLRGQQAVGVASVAKHFPGHGDTSADSHFALPRIEASMAHLQQVELPPFRAAIEAGTDAIMTAHIALPNVAHAGQVPATLSRPILTHLLREQLGYDGVVITDGLEMQGIAQRFGIGPSAVQAIAAGADMPMVLWSDEGCEQAYAALLQAVDKGVISASRLDASVRRILRAKARRGLLGGGDIDAPAPSGDGLKENRVHAQLMQRIAEDGVTLVRNDGALLPLGPDVTGWAVAAPDGPFLRQMREQGVISHVTLSAMPSRAQRAQEVERLLRLADGAQGIVAAVANRYHVDIVAAARAARPRVAFAVVSLASPYWFSEFADVEAFVCTYSTLPVAQRAAADVVMGERIPKGRLPVTLGPQAGVGTAMPWPTAAP